VLPIAAAAVLIGLLAIAIPRIGGQSNDVRTTAETSDSSGGATEGAAAPAARSSARELARLARNGAVLTTMQGTVDEDALRDLVDTAAAQWGGVAFPTVARSAEGAGVPASFAADTMSASKCVFKGVPEDKNKVSILVRLLEATYQGRPVYVAVALESTAVGQPADQAVAWVVYRDDCTSVRFASVKI
jgi:hypothetical protein